MNTQGNTIFISGGSAGIGFEIAKLFSEKGNKVIINGRKKERLDNALKQLNNAYAIQGDLSQESERIRIVNELKQTYPDLNVIINNAGTAFGYSLAEAKNAYENAQQEISTNYLGIIHFTELLLPHLLKKNNSAIVNITSIVAFLPLTTMLPTYSASKAALHSYTQTLRTALQNKIQVFEVMPPLVDTEFAAGINAPKIKPIEVAEELLLAFKNNQFDVPVGQTKQVYAMFQEVITKINSKR